MKILAFLLLSFLSVLSVQAHREHSSCSRELEGIVYTPKVCAFEYLQKITETLTINGPLLFVNETAKPLFAKFATTYNVHVYVVDAFGFWYNYPGGPGLAPPIPIHLLDRAYGVGEGFANFQSNSKVLPPAAYSYAKVIWNFDGVMYTIVVIVDKVETTSLTSAGCC